MKLNLPTNETPIKTASKPIIICGLSMFVCLFIIAAIWAGLSHISGAVIAQGQVVVLGKPKTVQHLDGGIVAQINIDNGDLVKKDDILIRLDDTLLKANLNIYQNRLLEKLAERTRLIAERDDLEQLEWNNEILDLFAMKMDPDIFKGQQKLFEARKESIKGQIDQSGEKISQYKNQMSGFKALEKSRATQLEIMDEELGGIRQLSEKSLVSKSRLRAMEREREEIIGEIAEQQAEIARIQNAISETQIQILQIGREFRQSVLAELREVEQEVNEATQQLYTTLEQLKRIDIKAPVSGHCT